MQDSIQKLWSDSVEIEGIAASMVLRPTDDQYIGSVLPLLKSKIADLNAFIDSIQVDVNETNDSDNVAQPIDTSEPDKPLYREIIKETIVIESNHTEPVEIAEPIEYPTEPQLVENKSPEIQPERLLVEESEPSLPAVFRHSIENYSDDEDISEDNVHKAYNSDVAIEPDPDTEPAIEPEDEFEPVLDPEPEPEAEAEIEKEIEQTAQSVQVIETQSIDSAVESEEKLEEAIAEDIREVEHPDPAETEVSQSVTEEAGVVSEAQQTEESKPISAKIEPALPEGEPNQTEQIEPEQPKQVEETKVQTPTEPESQISLDQKLSRKISKNFRQAISLNDKFRFRRELFGNSSQQYDAALDLIGEMSSFEEARDYFLDNYGWDADNDDVKSFFEILSNHFND
ncbi:MAG: hypothetical protein K2K27_02475 [Muribaculaceae bacterium]|nr:hypothetical protein [Muribaculaceae bacterium]